MSHAPSPYVAPSVPARRPDQGLPRWTLPVALVGLVVLVISTLPALVAKRRLGRVERRLDEEIETMERSAERIRRDRHALRSDEFVIDRAMRELLDPGSRLALTNRPSVARPK